MKLIRRNRALILTLTLLALMFGAPLLVMWRQYRLDHDLIAAVRRNDALAAMALLNQGANANIRDVQHADFSLPHLLLVWLSGKATVASHAPTPLLLALEPANASSTPGPRVYLPENLALVRALLDHGAAINAQDNGLTPLDLAILSGKDETIHLLLEHGADVRPTHGGTKMYLSVPLIWACGAGSKCSLTVIADLLNHGANINDQDSLGQTPLFAATTRFRVDVVRLLLAHHADLNAKDWRGQTVLTWCRRFRNAPELREITPLLEQAATANHP